MATIKISKNMFKYFKAIKENNKDNWLTAREQLSKNEIKFMVKEFVSIPKIMKGFQLTNEDLNLLTEWNIEAENLMFNTFKPANKDNLLDVFEAYISYGDKANYILMNKYWNEVKTLARSIDASNLNLLEIEV